MPVVKFAGDVTWPEATPWPDKPFDRLWEGSVVAVAITGYQKEEDGGFVYLLYEDGTVDDSYCMTLDDAIATAEEEGDRLGWIELPAD